LSSLAHAVRAVVAAGDDATGGNVGQGEIESLLWLPSRAPEVGVLSAPVK